MNARLYCVKTASDILRISFLYIADVAKLDLDWLKVFVTIYQTGSVSRAAEALDTAQASASIALAKLRLHFGDRLFSRTSRGMEATPYAAAIYPELLRIVENLAKIAGQAPHFDALESKRKFRIGMTDISEIVILPTLVNHLRRVAPGVRIEAEQISTQSPLRLESGAIDLAVGFMPHLEAGFHQWTLFRQNFVCLASKRHPRVRSKPTRRAFLAEAHLVVTTSGTGHSIVDKLLARHGYKRDVVLELPSFLGVARIVAQTELLVIVPRRLGEMLAHQESVAVFDTPLAIPPYTVKQHWHQRFQADPGNAWLRRTMADLLAER